MMQFPPFAIRERSISPIRRFVAFDTPYRWQWYGVSLAVVRRFVKSSTPYRFDSPSPLFFTKPSNTFYMAFQKVLEGLPANFTRGGIL